jgi:transposase
VGVAEAHDNYRTAPIRAVCKLRRHRGAGRLSLSIILDHRKSRWPAIWSWGRVSLLAGIDLLTGQVHALVRDRHRSCEFIEFLKLLDAAYPVHTAIKLIVDNHSAHISKETKAWLADQPVGRFEFTFTPKHGSWLNLVEGFFSKLARSVLRHIRVASKQELKDRIMAANFVPCSTKTVSQNQPLETAASKPVESPKSVSGDWLPTPEIARNRANSRVSQESKFEPGLVG